MINGKHIKVLIDTEASHNFINSYRAVL